MSYTDLRDFEPEYSTTIAGLHIELEKLGGGTVGRAYEGTWRYVVTDADGAEWQGQDATTGTPKTHAQVARILADFLGAES